ncbi:MAG: ferrous iron transport protein A [Oscillospiraceae bacterium]|nr:ferrous iron transport protein A [Oscillospiraceae bacterium]
MHKTLKDISIGREARVVAVGGESALRHRLLDMGITPKTVIRVRKVAPLGDPIELTLRGYSLTLRKEDAARITVEEVEE